jgi:hypothetical protein
MWLKEDIRLFQKRNTETLGLTLLAKTGSWQERLQNPETISGKTHQYYKQVNIEQLKRRIDEYHPLK